MASEDLLKKAVAAFNALSPEQQAQMLEEQRQSWVRGNIGLSRDERGMTSPVMPRPAPAATDTGLTTVRTEYRLTRGSYVCEWSPFKQPIFSDDKYETRELVTRSQAEELLAAAMKDRLPKGHTILEQADTLDGRVSQTVRVDATGEEYERIVHADEAYGEEE
ncbi:hypothetical protein [Brucella intermedia]|uniref:hypothetical protein n=1 Tax=Brucella intermedia TaxID=94625 RepID=UPI0004686DA9|nr:hypothetical protein [Brucella intermedia]